VAKKEEKPAEKRMKKTNLDFSKSCLMSSTKAEIDVVAAAFAEKEVVAMANVDRVAKEIANANVHLVSTSIRGEN